MSPGEKQAWLPNQAVDCKRGILTMQMPDPNDDSIEAHRIRMLVLSAAEQTIRLKTNQLVPAVADDGIEEVIEERRQKALAQIERMDEESKRTGDGKTKKPN